MNDTRYVPIRDQGMKTYMFRAEVTREKDGRFSAWIAGLPGCAAWGYTEKEALAALRDAAQAYVEVLIEKGQRIPLELAVDTAYVPVVAVTV